MTLIRDSILKKAVRDGVLHRGTLRICNFSKSLDNDIDVSPAGGFIDFLKGMDVIKEEYAKKGFVKKNRALFLYNEGLVDKKSTLLLARKGDRVLGTIGVIREKNNKLPCSKLFAEELQTLNLQHRQVTEIGALSIKSDAGTENLVFMLYLKTMMYAIFVDKVDDIVVQVREKVAAFYIRNLLFEQIGATKIHPDYGNIHTCLLRVDVKAIREKIYEKPQYGTRGWIRILHELGLLAEYKKTCHQSWLCNKFTLDKKDAELYHYLCHL